MFATLEKYVATHDRDAIQVLSCSIVQYVIRTITLRVKRTRTIITLRVAITIKLHVKHVNMTRYYIQQHII